MKYNKHIMIILILTHLCFTPCLSKAFFLIPDTTLAHSFSEQANAFHAKSQYDSANKYLEKASAIYEKAAAQYDELIMWSRYIQCINKMGDNLQVQGKYQDAMIYFNKALDTGLRELGENHVDIASLYNSIGVIYLYDGDYNRTLEYFEKAMTIRIQILGENHLEVAGSYNNMGIIFERMGKYDTALQYYHKALRIKSHVLGEQHPKVADKYTSIGILYFSKGDYDTSLEFDNKALAIRLKSLGLDHPKVAFTYYCIGTKYYHKGYFDKALEYCKKAVVTYLKTLNENHFRIVESYETMGLIYHDKGDIFSALDYFNKSLAIETQIHGECHPLIADFYRNIGSIHLDQNDYHTAMEYYNKSLDIRLELMGEHHPKVAEIFKDLGILYASKGSFDKALEYYNKSLGIYLHSLGENNDKVADAYHLIANVYCAKNAFTKAKNYYNKSLAICCRVLGRNHPEVARLYLSLAELYLKQNDCENALFNAQKSIVTMVDNFNALNVYANPSEKNIRADQNLLNALEFKAETFQQKYSLQSHDLKDIKTSFTTFKLAMDLIDKIRSSYLAEDSKLFLGEKTTELFNKTIDTAIKLNAITRNTVYKEKAFLFAEKAKSAVLLSLLQDSKAKEFAGIPDSLLKIEKQFRMDIAGYETNLQNELQKKEDRDSVRIVSFRNKLFDLNQSYQKLIARFEQEYPKYYQLKYQTRAPTVNDMQKILGTNTALIEYYASDETLFIFTITKESFNAISTSLEIPLIQQILPLVRSVKKVDMQHYAENSHAVYQLLIRPVETDIWNKKKLFIIPHGILFKLPFEALISEMPGNHKQYDFSQYQYLLNEFEISYHYSAALAMESGLKKTRKKRIPSADRRWSFAGFAPVFSDQSDNGYILSSTHAELNRVSEESEIRSIMMDGKRFSELKYSEREIREIVRLFEKNNGQAIGYFYDRATEKKFKSSIGQYRYIHVASHGLIREDCPELSGIIFSQPKDTSAADDGILFSGETYNLDLNADLVVLSSCESGLGKLVKGEGLMALTRGFLSSGASNLLISLWKVDDRYTSNLMIAFYTHVFNGESYSEALRNAKLEMIREPKTAFPVLWGSFVLIGQ